MMLCKGANAKCRSVHKANADGVGFTDGEPEEVLKYPLLSCQYSLSVVLLAVYS